VVIAVVFGVQLAGLGGVVRRMNRVTGRHMAVMAGGFGFAGMVGLGGVAVMRGGLFVMLGRVGVVLVGVVRSHGRLSLVRSPRSDPGPKRIRRAANRICEVYGKILCRDLG